MPTLAPLAPGAAILGVVRDPRWIHSPKKGKGHMVHQALERKGTMSLIRRNHQKIQTKTIRMLRLPTGVPQTPAARKTRKRKRLGRTTANWNQRRLTSHLSQGKVLSKSMRQPSKGGGGARGPVRGREAGVAEGEGRMDGLGLMFSLMAFFLYGRVFFPASRRGRPPCQPGC